MSNIHEQVLNALHWDLAVPRGHLVVKVDAVWVTLSGEVDLPYQKSCAEADVLKVDGVLGVRNEIAVRAQQEQKSH